MTAGVTSGSLFVEGTYVCNACRGVHLTSSAEDIVCYVNVRLCAYALNLQTVVASTMCRPVRDNV